MLAGWRDREGMGSLRGFIVSSLALVNCTIFSHKSFLQKNFWCLHVHSRKAGLNKVTKARVAAFSLPAQPLDPTPSSAFEAECRS